MPATTETYRLAKTQDQLADLPVVSSREGDLDFSLMYDDIPNEVIIERPPGGSVRVRFTYDKPDSSYFCSTIGGVTGYVGAMTGRMIRIDFNGTVDRSAFDTWASHYFKDTDPIRKKMHKRLISEILFEIKQERPSGILFSPDTE